MKQITGVLKKGKGRAAGFVGIEWVQQQCRKRFGFFAYPGTLNIEVSAGVADYLEAAHDISWIPLVPPDASYCTSQAAKIEINGIPGLIFRPEKKKNIHGRRTIEVISPLYLRHVLKLEDGDTVSLDLQTREPTVLNSKMRVSAVLFDLDGTLIDSIESYYRIVEMALEQLRFPAVQRDVIASAVKARGFDWRLVLPEMDDERYEHHRKKAWQIIEGLYPKMFETRVDIFPGADRTVEILHEKGIRVALVTATPKKNMAAKLGILEKYHLLEKADVIVCSDDTAYKKPYPDPLIFCCRKMNLACARCAYVGDVGGDIIAGRAAGMKTIAVTTGFETRQDLLRHRPDAVIDDITQLVPIVT